jgi:hypothetical protein
MRRIVGIKRINNISERRSCGIVGETVAPVLSGGTSAKQAQLFFVLRFCRTASTRAASRLHSLIRG